MGGCELWGGYLQKELTRRRIKILLKFNTQESVLNWNLKKNLNQFIFCKGLKGFDPDSNVEKEVVKVTVAVFIVKKGIYPGCRLFR